MMQTQSVVIKGINEGLLIALSATEELGALTADLAARIDGQSSFFNGAHITLDVGSRPIRKDELGSIKAMLERRGLSLYAVNSESMTTIDSATALDLRAYYTGVTAETSPVEGDFGAANAAPDEEGSIGVMIRRTMRSGRSVQSQGHVVVFGDVNAGAEIIASGDIIIWGRLRGHVHAGANGDETAVVCALDMMPTQMRIAGYITTSPPDKKHKPKPEMASIRESSIVVEGWA